jgi:hypothetical protein
MSVDRDDVVAAVSAISDAVGDIDALRAAQVARYNDRTARLELLKQDRRVTETRGEEFIPDGLLRYHLNTPIQDMTGSEVKTITFRKPTVQNVRKASRYSSMDEWTAYMVKDLSYEIADDETLNKIDAAEWDAIVEVARFPFEFAPTRIGEKRPVNLASSGGAS